MRRNRKLFLCAGVVVIATALCCFHFLTGGEWVTVASLVVSAYVTGNVAQKATSKQPADGRGGQPED